MLLCRQPLWCPRALGLPLAFLFLLLAGSSCQSRREAEDPAAEQARRLRARLHHDSLRTDSVARAGGQLPGAILPGQRIVAFYGSATHKTMGVLGQYPKDEMLRRLDEQVQAWRRADPATPIRPALHMVAVIAQRRAGPDGKYRELQPDSVIRRMIRWGHAHGCLVFLDVQVGLSSLPAELPRLAPYLHDSIVHLGIDPEFSMKNGRRPGTEVGEFDAADVNYARRFLARLVSQHRLPPKVLVVHRFRQDMLTNYRQIKTDPRVQIVMHMDGWGTPSIKRRSYRKYIRAEPVEYAGFKIFFKQDRKMDNSRLMTPQEVAALRPDPLYIQYQ
jgi:hypothetical protein